MTRLRSKIDQAQDTEINREATEVFLARLDDIRIEAEAVHLAIALHGHDEAGPTVADASEESDFEEKYLELKIKLKQWLSRLPAQQSNVPTSSTSEETLNRMLQQQGEFLRQLSMRANESSFQDGGSQPSTSGSSDAVTRLVEQQTALLRRFTEASGANQESKVKLPVVKLPTFDGRTEEWKRFCETFTSLIHLNESIPNIQKFQYLVTSLSSVAAKIIESIELTGENYEIAWDLLKKRFDDPRAIKKKHIQCLFAMPKVERESATAIRNLIDYALKHLRVLKSLKLPTEAWDELVIHMIETKLDMATLRAWEQEGNTADAKLNTLTDFLEAKCQMLERIEARTKEKEISKKVEPDKPKPKTRSQTKAEEGERRVSLATSTDAGKCYLCRGDHFLYHCENFLALSIEDRVKEIRRLKLCINCLRNDHFVKTCKMGSCRECSGRHNTLCHRPTVNKVEQKSEAISEPQGQSSSDAASNNVVVHHAANGPSRSHVLMATAVVNGKHPNGSIVPLRILLDSASEAHFITQSACTKLGVKRDRTSEIVTGLSEIESVVSESCEVTLQSRYLKFGVVVRSFVVPKITKSLPSFEIDASALKIPANIKLADSAFFKRSAIDMLIGAEFFFDLLDEGRINLGENQPVLQNTKLGWIIAGNIGRASRTTLVCNREKITSLTCSLKPCEALDQTLKKFWEIENVQTVVNHTPSEEARASEEFFERTTTRDKTGRFIVRLPFIENPDVLGESRETANKRLTQLERRFKGNKILRERYVEFMRDYLDSGHMSPASDRADNHGRPKIYLPHHGVMKESSTSTKLRAVFDASSKTSSGKSLNNILRVGPTIQSSLFDVVMRFRFYNVALTGDIRQMYRQVLVHPDDRDCQRILWRFSTDEPVQDFRLNTVTYGQASSAYLAIRCILNLAEEAKTDFPTASRVILEQTYVDDILAGASDIEGAATLLEQITTVLRGGGFHAHKWCSDRHEALEQVPSHLKEDTSKLSIDANDAIKTLGLEWRPTDDEFQFCVQETKPALTKREVLSAISKFFDPLGLIGPIITTAKLIMQETWRSDRSWDETLPPTFIEKWEKFRSELNEVKTLSIPRRVIPYQDATKIYLQGFCDASEVAYGACIYVQAKDETGNTSSRLLCSKSRVAPIKPTTIPRLELCSAVLLAHLIANIRRELRIKIDGVQAWSDSQVALWWIRGDVSRWKPFVANRVNEIIEVLPAEHWNHVRGAENPADLISRGTTPQQLQESKLWWFGPQWLRERDSPISFDSHSQETEPTDEILGKLQAEERKKFQACALVNDDNSLLDQIIAKFSSLTKIERVLAYCLRFVRNAKKPPSDRKLSTLSISEIQEAHIRLVQHVQGKDFRDEITDLKKNRDLKTSSKILQLQPFLDDRGVLRVGGRLQYSSWKFERKHPIILPAGTRLSKLLFEREHRRLLHAGQQLLLSTVKEKYWPLRGRDLARQVCHECMRCARNNPQELKQLMGPLPSDRVRPSRPFTVTGIDFAGPIVTLVNKGRGRKTNKSYVALFVCFTTKAVHLEATSELTSAAFLATLRRFIGRRGRPQRIYSDNATNFVGAKNELDEIRQFLNAQIKSNFGDILVNEGIDWKFIPPRSPHMGGLWEAGIKSCKYHLKRVMCNALFTFEEFSTALVQIEACLNSRPITALSDDPSDLQPLTPAHFLVGGSLTSLEDIDLSDVALNRLDRWQLAQRVSQDFWKRWAAEYLTSLQGKTKWKKEQVNLKINDLVLLRDENLPPLRWKLGRVSELHPGHDGLVRVVSIRTDNGNFKRAIAKLCKLPLPSASDAKISDANLVGGMSAIVLRA